MEMTISVMIKGLNRVYKELLKIIAYSKADRDKIDEVVLLSSKILAEAERIKRNMENLGR